MLPRVVGSKVYLWRCLTLSASAPESLLEIVIGSLDVKNVHLSRTLGLAEFPDCKAARSTRHLEDLAAQIREGHRAVALFVVQREDCETFQACADLDPAFAAGLERAADAGVEVLVYACAMSTEAVRISRRIAWDR